SVHEGGHLAAGDGLVGAEAVVVGWVAAADYVGGAEGVDVGLEDRDLVVGEPVRAVREMEASADEGGNLAAGVGLVGAVAVVVGCIADAGYVRGGDGFDVGLEDRVLVAGEPVPAVRQFEGPGDEGGHLAAGDGPIGTIPVVSR